ncbi:nuclear transport factor 2 family protein [Micromonospora chersina]|uniref:nuclear transport factor 2 family protein n=1 Tax=Micromonospora chersina TaxID=47854 RepID=UPI00367C5DCB
MADDVVGRGHTRFVDQGRQLAERMYEAFNRRDAAAAEDIFASNFYSHPLAASGWECVQRAWQRMWDQHPALEVTLKDLVADNQRVATRTEMVGFADGSTATMLEMFTFENDHIVELWGLSAKPQTKS